MRKRLFAGLVAAVCLLALSCNNGKELNGHIRLSAHEISIAEGQYATLSVVAPAPDVNCYWITSDPEVIQLSNNVGNDIEVIALKDGDAEVKAFFSNKLDEYDACAVTVRTKRVTSLTFDNSSSKRSRTDLVPNDFFVENLNIEPQDASNQRLECVIPTSSQDLVRVEQVHDPDEPEKIAYRITTLAAGEANIKFKTQDGSNKTAELTLRILKNRKEPTGISIFGQVPAKMLVGDKHIGQPVWTPADAGKVDYTVTSSNPSVIKAMQSAPDGVFVLEALAAGNATITVKDAPYAHYSSSMPITVVDEGAEHKLSFDLDNESLKDFIFRDDYYEYIELTTAKRLYLPVIRTNTSDKVEWTSSDPSAVTITPHGDYGVWLSTATDNSTAQFLKSSTITATCKDHPEASVSIRVDCYNVPEELTLRVYRGSMCLDDPLSGFEINSTHNYAVYVFNEPGYGKYRQSFVIETSPSIQNLISVTGTPYEGYNFAIRRLSETALPKPVGGNIKIYPKGLTEPSLYFNVIVK